MASKRPEPMVILPGVEDGLLEDGGAIVAAVVVFECPLGVELDVLGEEALELGEFDVVEVDVIEGVDLEGDEDALLLVDAAVGYVHTYEELVRAHARRALRGARTSGSCGGPAATPTAGTACLVGRKHLNDERVGAIVGVLDLDAARPDVEGALLLRHQHIGEGLGVGA